ncbi:MAG TPA: CheR family methyltransferase [bacterium]|nr:CheR family methyltransferase [bacterium]HND76258.1 CheR family methyltransferase [bacterium]HNH33438.1 CheR family methyltransferase [bacterium]HNI11633.1 CheR family methyltransferase [bacterium]HNO91204.1 CheR family methyltransferase [bacterium]
MLNYHEVHPMGTGHGVIAKEADFTDQDFIRFRNLIRARSGIYFNDRKRADLKSGVLKAFHYSGVSGLDKYFDLLASDPTQSAQFKTLVSFLTVGETYFFRHFDVIEKVVLPSLIKAHHHDKTIRIWSAGCSTGEEPYTVAMVLHNLLPDIRDWKISIVGTDINVNSVEYAKEGVYRPWSLRSITDFYKNFYFDKKDGLYYIKDFIRNMVRFDYLNLVDDGYPRDENGTKDLDLIFCRNVTIYFEAETTIKVVNRFYDCLKEKSFLAVGHAEPSSLVYDKYISEIYPDAVIYRKDTALKKEQQYKTGIRTRRDIFKEFKDQTSVVKNQGIINNLDTLQQRITKLDITDTVKKENPVLKSEPKPREPLFKADNLTITTMRAPLKPQPGAKPNDRDAVIEEKRRAELNEAELFTMALEEFYKKDFREAEKHFTALIEKNPANGRALYMIAHINANLDNVSKAKDFCHMAIAEDSLMLEAYYLLGLIYKEENLFDESVRMLKKTIYIDSDFAIGYYELAVNYFKLGDGVQARKYLKQTERILKNKSDDERVGILDDLKVKELRMMVNMWDN